MHCADYSSAEKAGAWEKPEIKLIASDMDGTLLNDNGEISEEFFELIDELNRKGIIFVACSGRFYATMVRNFCRIKNGLILAAHNGAVIQRSNFHEAMFESDIDNELVKYTLSALEGLEAEIYLSTKDTAYVVNPSPQLKEKFIKTDVDFIEVASFSEVGEGVKKIGVFQGDGLTESVIRQAKQAVTGILECVVSGVVWLDIMNMNINKGKALEMIERRFGIGQDQTMVFGDYYNDIELFRKAKYSFAMENAPPRVKKTAEFIAPDNNSNGVVTVIKQYLSGEYGFFKHHDKKRIAH